MSITKAVCDAGQGGMILISADAVERIFIESLEQKVMVRGTRGAALLPGDIMGYRLVTASLPCLPQDMCPSPPLHLAHTLPPVVQILHMGDHQVTAGAGALPVMPLYQLVRKNLVTRVCMLDPVRTIEQRSMGVLEAPAGLVTVVFM